MSRLIIICNTALFDVFTEDGDVDPDDAGEKKGKKRKKKDGSGKKKKKKKKHHHDEDVSLPIIRK